MWLIFRDIETIQKKSFSLTKEETRHLKALRLVAANTILIGDGQQYRWKGKLQYNTNEWCVEVLPASRIESYEAKRILYTALPDAKPFTWLLEKAVELGVSFIQPVVWQRSDRSNYNKERSQRIIEQAASQSKRFYLPHIAAKSITSKEFFASFRNSFVKNQLPNICSLRAKKSLESVMLDKKENHAFCVGPVGDFSNEEYQSFLDDEYPEYLLGPHILKVETAAIAALAKIS